MDDLDRALAGLPRADVGELTASSIAIRAQREFTRAHARMRPARSQAPIGVLPFSEVWAQLARSYNRVEPLLVAAVALMYLGFATSRLLQLLG